MSLKKLFELAGVDVTKGKAKELVEAEKTNKEKSSLTHFKGTLVVYRESARRETLRADVKLENGDVLLYPRAPKCFEKLITDGTKNKIKIEFDANSDGRNPRNVKTIGNPE